MKITFFLCRSERSPWIFFMNFDILLCGLSEIIILKIMQYDQCNQKIIFNLMMQIFWKIQIIIFNLIRLIIRNSKFEVSKEAQNRAKDQDIKRDHLRVNYTQQWINKNMQETFSSIIIFFGKHRNLAKDHNFIEIDRWLSAIIA